ncbi:MAG: hypothetical protein IIA34_14600 [Proteobacteria bacterium]|nr:hypothetical protein [Pseudomonadota bacterium]MCH9013173.1 hypothetical protein [Pseudomonadota bacterium]
MRLVIEQSDFRRLSAQTRNELLEALTGKSLPGPRPAKPPAKALWREPMDLSPDLAVRLLHGLSQPHRARLALFAKKGTRVTQRDLLKATNDSDMRVLSHFQAVLSRRLRRLLDDPDKRIHLIGWDFDATKWDKSHSNIINGIYYVTEATARTLRNYFGLQAKRTSPKA